MGGFWGGKWFDRGGLAWKKFVVIGYCESADVAETWLRWATCIGFRDPA